MKWAHRIGWIGLLLCWTTGAQAAFASFQVSSNPIPVADTVCTITTGNCTGVGAGTSLFTTATCNGVADDSAGFISFNSWAVGTWQVAHPGLLLELDIPSGKTCEFGGADANHNKIGQGLKSFQIVGYGATFGDFNGTGGGFVLGATGGVGFNGITSTVRLATVSAGATTIVLLDTSKCGLFNAGDAAAVTGVDQQGGGDPPSPRFLDWIRVTSTATCAVDGKITFTALRNDGGAGLTFTYKSTWPFYNPGNAFNSDQGGPATLYRLNQEWDTKQAFYGLTFNQSAGQTNSLGRDITFQDVTWIGALCGIPSQNLIWRATNWTGTNCDTEADKMVTEVRMTNFTARQLKFQQISPLTWSCDHCTIGPLGVAGTPGNSTITNSNFSDLGLGSLVAGTSGSMTISNTVISSLERQGANQASTDKIGVWASGTLTVPPNFHVLSAASNGGIIRLTVDSSAGWSNGLTILQGAAGNCPSVFTNIQVINATTIDLPGTTFSGTCSGLVGNLPLGWAEPGGYVYFSSSQSPLGPILQVADLAVGANNSTVVSFNLNGSSYAGGLPTLPEVAGILTITAHPAPQWSCTNCTGALNVLDVTNVPTGPFGSTVSRVVTAANSGSAIAIPTFGQLTELDMTITAACSGASNFGFLQSMAITTLNSSVIGTWNPTANGLIASATPRKVFPTTSSGAQSGDSLATPGAGTWLVNGQVQPSYSSVGNCGAASTTVTIKTDQGVTFP